MSYQTMVDRDLVFSGHKPTDEKEAALLPQWESGGIVAPGAARRIKALRKASKVAPLPADAPLPSKDRHERLRWLGMNEWERHALMKAVGRILLDEELAPGRCRTLLDKLINAKEK